MCFSCSFFCSEFVAQMLVVAGRVHRHASTAALDFLPNNSEGRVLSAPIALQCPPRRFSTSFQRTSMPSKAQEACPDDLP